MSSQDWNPVVIRKKAPAAGTTINADAVRGYPSHSLELRHDSWPFNECVSTTLLAGEEGWSPG